MKKWLKIILVSFLTTLLTLVIVAGSIWYFAPKGATFSRSTTWSSGQVLTAANLNAEFDNILNNLTPAGVDDESSNATAMQATADPYPGSVASLSTSLQGEIQRIRYQLDAIIGGTYWYEDAPTNLTTTDADTLGTYTYGFGNIAATTTNQVLIVNATHTIDSTYLPLAQVANVVTDQGGGSNIQLKIANIGDWNMDSTASVSIAHGLTASKIVGVEGWVITDDGTKYFTIAQNADNTVASLSFGDSTAGTPQGSWDATNINIYRKGASYYDSTTFDSVSPTLATRGKIFIKYTE